MKVYILLHTLVLAGTEHQVVESVHYTKEGAIKALHEKGTSIRDLGNDIYDVSGPDKSIIYVIIKEEIME